MSVDIESMLVGPGLTWLTQALAKIAPCLKPLSEQEIEMARSVGVLNPEQVKVGLVDYIPVPANPALKAACDALELDFGSMQALAVGPIVLLQRDAATPALLKHELRLVYHFERAGSLEAYFRSYLAEVIEFGYGRTPMELDAARAAVGEL